ncbi:VENN motif pre-toxin domain-containing protein, partial [Pseudoxanthomonas broegbernensis]
LIGHALLGALLAEANGTSAAGGALAAAGGELAAKYLTQKLYGTTDPADLDEAQKQALLGLSQALGALAGGLTGGNLGEAATGSNIAGNAVENNILGREDQARLDELREKSKKSGDLTRQEASDLVLLEVADQISDGLLRKLQSGAELTVAEMENLNVYLGNYFLQEGSEATWKLVQGEAPAMNSYQYAGLNEEMKAYVSDNFTFSDRFWGHAQSENESIYRDARRQAGLSYVDNPNESLTPAGLRISSFLSVYDTLASSPFAGAAYLGAIAAGASDETRDKVALTAGQIAQIGSSFILPKAGISPIFGEIQAKSSRVGLNPVPVIVEDAKVASSLDVKKTNSISVGSEDLHLYRERLGLPKEINTIAVARTDIPGLGGVIEGASPAVRNAAGLPRMSQGEIASPNPSPLFKNHAEEDIANKVVSAVERQGLSPSDLDGRTLSIHISNPTGVCPTCVQGLENPNVPPGVLKQLSNKYPGLTIRVTVEPKGGKVPRTGSIIVIRGGNRVRAEEK